MEIGDWRKGNGECIVGRVERGHILFEKGVKNSVGGLGVKEGD